MRELEINDFQMDIEKYSNELVEKEQLLAIIIRPDADPEENLGRRFGFEFCGYDLVENFSCISAITNNECMFSNAINCKTLTKYGLLPDYKEALLTQIKLREKHPDENHAYCDVVEVWRKIVNRDSYR